MKYTNINLRLLALLLAIAGIGSQARAQEAYASTPSLSAYNTGGATENLDDTQSAMITIRAKVNEVNVLFIATDKHGKFVRDLTQQDFTILDDHKPPEAIVNFRRETDLPLHLGLLIDVSGSVHSRFDFEQNAATSFLQHTIRAKFDKAFVLGFNTQTQLTQDFTDNVQSLSAGIQRLQEGGGTALYDAIYKICREKMLKDRPNYPVRKALVILS